MKKIIIIIFASVFFISACGIETKTEYATKADRPVRTDTEETYEILNHNLLGKDFLKYIGEDLLVRGVCDYSEGVKGDFVPVIKEKSIFPEDLVVMLEEAFYHSSNVMSRGNESAYMEKLNAWGAEEFMLEMDDLYLHFPEIAVYKEQIQWEEEAYDLICDIYGGPVKCLRCFYIPLTDGDQYAFLYQSGGSNGALSVCLTELIDNQLVWVNEFEVQNDGDGRVILYEGEFYYVFLELNLVQMWFKEIDEKIYTFRIYHICDYNYMMNIVILNGDKADPVGTYVLLPQRGFVLTEGEVFTTCG